MQEKQVYEYAFIRFVPRVEREEFINVGVILFSKKNDFLRVKYHLDVKRLEAFNEDIDLKLLGAYLNTWELIARGDSKGGKIAGLDQPSRFRWLTASRSTIIQSSPVHPGLCNDPEKVLGELFEKFVL